MWKINIHPKLWVKATILVAIPLGVQFLSVGVLSHMLKDAEEQTERVQKARALTNEALLLAKIIYDSEKELFETMDAVRNGLPYNQSSADQFLNLSRQIPTHLDRIEELSESRPEDEKFIARRFVKNTHKLLKVAQALKRGIDRGDLTTSVFPLAMMMKSEEGPLTLMSQDLDKLTRLAERQAQMEVEASEKREKIQSYLYMSLGINVIVIILLLIFNRGTITRLNVLVDNTRRFAERKPLLLPLEGTDEIAQLDHSFHDMADSILAARKREQELLEIKKQLMAMVSHDLRSPLTSLLATLSLLNRSVYGELSEAGKARVALSEGSVQRLIRMINDLLDLEKLEAGAMEMHIADVPLSVIVGRSIEAVSEMAAAQGVKFQYDEQEFDVRGDGDRLIQVVVNLLSNAVKYSPENSTVLVRSKLAGDMIELRVDDSGPGVPEASKLLIFERYRQIEDSAEHKGKGGTGLGLAICKIIVEQHHGSIGVDSSDSGGSSFWIKLPGQPLAVAIEDQATASA